jgi:hypothetical protein
LNFDYSTLKIAVNARWRSLVVTAQLFFHAALVVTDAARRTVWRCKAP